MCVMYLCLHICIYTYIRGAIYETYLCNNKFIVYEYCILISNYSY